MQPLEGTPLLPPTLSPRKKLLITFTLFLTAHASSITTSIRYGFLVIACTQRGIPGSIYGFIESTKLVGYLFAFGTRSLSDKHLTKVSPKAIVLVTMFTLMATCLISGLAIFSSSNLIFLTVSIGMRIVQGYAAFFFQTTVLDIGHTLYNKEFDTLNGVMQCGYFTGHGVGQWMGAALYDHYGYFVPFVAASLAVMVPILMCSIVIPAVPSYANIEKTPGDKGVLSDAPKDRRGLTWLIGVPLLSIILVNCIYNVIQVFITPYLLDNFSISLTVGGTVLTCASLGMGVGSVLSGILTQAEIISTYTQMSLGALMVAVGVLFTFPNPSLGSIYYHPLSRAYPSVFLSSLGDPILTIPSLRAMKQLQARVRGECSPAQSLSLTTIWLVGTNCGSYTGATIAGVMIEYLKMYQSGYVLASLCGISMCCSLALRLTTSQCGVKESQSVKSV